MLWKLTIIGGGWDDDNTTAYCAHRDARSVLIVADSASEAKEKITKYLRENKDHREIYPHDEIKNVSNKEIFFLA